MKINQALKEIDLGWVQKSKGFRVHFQEFRSGEWETDYSPGPDDAALDSDVVAWRLAWKLAQATDPAPPDFREGDRVNIYVVDDQGERFKYYATGDFVIFHDQPEVTSPSSDGQE